MKKRLLLIASAFSLCLFASAQGYTFNPVSKVVSGTVPTNGYLNLEIDITNNSGSAITFAYDLISNTLDSAWYVTLCDYQTCYPYIPTSHQEMDSLPNNEHAFLKLTVNPGTKTGTGSVSFKLYDNANQSVMDTLVFNVNSVVAVEPDLSNSVKVYPNPSNGNFYFAAENGSLDMGDLSVSDLTGKKIWQSRSGGVQRVELKLDNAAPGIYFVTWQTEKGKAQKKIMIGQ